MSISNGCRVGRRFAAALLPRLFGKNPRSHCKGAKGRDQTGDQPLPILCHCQQGWPLVVPSKGSWEGDRGGILPWVVVGLPVSTFRKHVKTSLSRHSWFGPVVAIQSSNLDLENNNPIIYAVQTQLEQRQSSYVVSPPTFSLFSVTCPLLDLEMGAVLVGL